MITIPEFSYKDLLEIKRRKTLGRRSCDIMKKYKVSYYNIKKITKMFKSCEFEEDIEKRIEEIEYKNELAKKKKADYKSHYLIHKEYYKLYSKKQYARLIGIKINIDNEKTKKEKIDQKI